MLLVRSPDSASKPRLLQAKQLRGRKFRTEQRTILKRMKGFEPSTFAMARRRSSQLSYIRKVSSILAPTTMTRPGAGVVVQAGRRARTW